MAANVCGFTMRGWHSIFERDIYRLNARNVYQNSTDSPAALI